MKRAALLAIALCCCLPGLDARGPVPGLVKSESGLKYANLRLGSGSTPKPGQLCSVLYRGWLYMDNRKGRLFDQNTNRKRPFTFRLGKGEVIKGWDEGIATMQVGTRRMLIVPPELAYGKDGIDADKADGIPGNATLIFEVELIAIQ
jgi:peptidylprolyl isomerase